MAKSVRQIVQERIAYHCRNDDRARMVGHVRTQIALDYSINRDPEHFLDGDIRRVIDDELAAVARFVEERQAQDGGPR